ncbi:DUF2177 family protein [Variovorax ureilyticus]|uniref:DUF2177 family protein n=1 Tax=Variovorax ureilyticus TaxID=1836198 RepID=UPI003D67313F
MSNRTALRSGANLSVRQFAVAYAASALAMLALDAAWLTLMADRLYRASIGHLMADHFDVLPAMVFYAVYLAGVVLFAVAPGLTERRWQVAMFRGAMFGLVAYATYDLTNQATLVRWPWQVTVVDLAWGTCLTAISAAAGCRAGMKWPRPRGAGR